MNQQLKATILILSAIGALTCSADSTIQAPDQYAYAANAGWINFRPDQPASPEGAILSDSCLSGFVYGANLGWINLGDGAPDNGFAYANNTATDFGVNHDGAGALSGFAYGANIGWIQFEQTHGQPKVNLETGDMSGYAYSANIGWIDLGQNGTYVVNTKMVCPSTDGDAISDAWELARLDAAGQSANLSVMNDSSDSDDDGLLDVDEFAADTDPFDDTDFLQIVSIEVAADVDVTLQWTSKPSRRYDVRMATSALGTYSSVIEYAPEAGSTTEGEVSLSSNPEAYFLIHPLKPLQ